MKVLLVTPMPSELAPVVRALGLERETVGAIEFRRGTVDGIDVYATRCGIGTARARVATERALNTTTFDHVMVVGIAGGMGSSSVGDVMVPEVVVDKDSGQEFHATQFGDAVLRGRLVTHDDFDMSAQEHQKLIADGFTAVDMETAAVAAVCDERGRPWSAVRAISDLVGVTPGDVIGLANPDGSPNVSASLRYLVTKPWRIPKLVKLARDSTAAAKAAAEGAAAALHAAAR